MKQIIIALSGRKGAGKDTSSQFIADYLVNLRINRNPKISIEPYVYICPFADEIKRFCVEVLNIPYNYCWGSEDEKNQLTEYSWDDIDVYIRWKFGKRLMTKDNDFRYPHNFLDGKDLRNWFYEHLKKGFEPHGLKTGPISSRDVMKIVGTELVRENFGNVWARSTIKRIKEIGRPVNIITDNRFPNETDLVLSEPFGYVIRLTRSPFKVEDKHISETSLDNYNWNKDKCFIVDNENKTVEERNILLVNVIEKLLEKVNIDFLF